MGGGNVDDRKKKVAFHSVICSYFSLGLGVLRMLSVSSISGPLSLGLYISRLSYSSSRSSSTSWICSLDTCSRPKPTCVSRERAAVISFPPSVLLKHVKAVKMCQQQLSSLFKRLTASHKGSESTPGVMLHKALCQLLPDENIPTRTQPGLTEGGINERFTSRFIVSVYYLCAPNHSTNQPGCKAKDLLFFNNRATWKITTNWLCFSGQFLKYKLFYIWCVDLIL